MGHWISKLSRLLDSWSKTPTRILMLGLDAAGKTTILYKLKLNETVATIPTIGFNVEEVKIKGLSFTVWDVGGQDRIRPLWRHYYHNSDGVMFIVDSNDRERLKEAAHELRGVMDDDEMRGVPLLVLANKQDLPMAMSPSDITDGLGLQAFRHRKWYVQGSNALTGDGIIEGLEQLAVMSQEFRKTHR